jgi:hypothetical protein
MADDAPTRGERNNNPGNINEGGGWDGDLGLEIVPAGYDYQPRFARFDTAQNGMRAIAKQLLAYQQRHGLNTVRGMINRWAPPSDDNDTSAYVDEVCAKVGVGPDDAIDLTDLRTIQNMVTGVIFQENGRVLYAPDLITAACQSALA